MASNFEIDLHKTRDSIHVKLYGDFDGTSAYELLNVLKNQTTENRHIFVDTEDLNTINPFGKNVFLTNFKILTKQSIGLTVIGKHKHSIYEEHLKSNR